MNDDLDKAKEILRQSELRIKGILNFSHELDNKIFKILGYVIALIYAFIFYLIIYKPKEILLYISIFDITYLYIIMFFLILAIRPSKYKGVGLPLEDFNNDYSLQQVINDKAIKRYKNRFENNKKINKRKSRYLYIALLLFYCLLIFTTIFYWLFKGIK